jgi:hypothetical protein
MPLSKRHSGLTPLGVIVMKSGATHWQQVFSIDASGTVEITKFPGPKRVTRPINNVIDHN